jgi:hypothetical protein
MYGGDGSQSRRRSFHEMRGGMEYDPDQAAVLLARRREDEQSV